VSSWASSEPDAFTRWAAGVTDPVRLAMIAPQIARARVQADSDGAVTWALQLPKGMDRDEALAEIAQFNVIQGLRDGQIVLPDERLLAGFSSDLIRQHLVASLANALARQDADMARAFADRYITDAAVRELLEQQIARSQR
jgi:hypothetical protein